MKRGLTSLITMKITSKLHEGSSHCGAAETNPTGIHEDVGLIPGLTQWLKIRQCWELWRRSQMQLGSHVAVAVA